MRSCNVAAAGDPEICAFAHKADSDFLTAEATAAILGVTVRAVYGLKRKGWPFIRVGRELRIRREKLFEHIERQERAAR